jgi:hypothetical protein
MSTVENWGVSDFSLQIYIKSERTYETKPPTMGSVTCPAQIAHPLIAFVFSLVWSAFTLLHAWL